MHRNKKLSEVVADVRRVAAGIPAGEHLAITDLAARPEFRGVHFARVMRAAEKLGSDGLTLASGAGA